MIGLLEQHELTARRRIDELREEADRIQVDHIQAERAAAEQEGQKRAVSRRRAGTVLGPDSGTAADIAGNQTVRLPPRERARHWCGAARGRRSSGAPRTR